MKKSNNTKLNIFIENKQRNIGKKEKQNGKKKEKIERDLWNQVQYITNQTKWQLLINYSTCRSTKSADRATGSN